jgi:hypothetical protein
MTMTMAMTMVRAAGLSHHARQRKRNQSRDNPLADNDTVVIINPLSETPISHSDSLVTNQGNTLRLYITTTKTNTTLVARCSRSIE